MIESAFYTHFYALSFLSCIITVPLLWLFTRCTGTFFVAKPRDWTPERHQLTKKGTPTMAGIILVSVWLIFMVIFGVYSSSWHILPSIFLMSAIGILGAHDDWSKINRTGGISAQQKFSIQVITALCIASIWYALSPGAGDLWIPFFDIFIPCGMGIILWATFIIVALSNAVNLTDGLDGLASTVLTLCFGAFTFIAIHTQHEASLCAGSLVAIGTLLSFLSFNVHPAQIFMGDTGSLAFGALVGLCAMQLNISLLLPCIAIVPLIETVSVMLQVFFFKRYQKRIFRMAPVHHHFELSGYSENQIVMGAILLTLSGITVAAMLLLHKN